MPADSTAPAPAEAVIVNKWDERLGAFAQAVGKPVDEIVNALTPLVGAPGDTALEVLSDPTALSDDDLKGVLVPAIPLGVFRKHLSKLRGPAPISVGADETRGPSFDILPTVPDDVSFLEMLKVGGVLKVGIAEVISAVKAAIANRLGLFELPGIIKDKMEEFAETQDEPVGEDYFKLQRLVVSRSYAEVLGALGIEGSFMSEGKKRNFFAKLEANLWGALRGFNTQLAQWQEAWMANAGNPGALMAVMLSGQLGKGGVMPPGMLQPPETAGLHDEAEAVINSINKVFAGVGIPVARALAYDATRIKAVLENAALPASVGATNRDQMLKSLGLAVGADFIRLERNVTRFTLAIMEFPKVTVPNEEYAYLGALMQLGATIPWDKIPESGVTSGPAGLGRRGSRTRED